MHADPKSRKAFGPGDAWRSAELKMKFTLKKYNRNVPDEDLIGDVIAVSKKTKKNKVTKAEYEKLGNYHPGTLCKRFGDWGTVLEKASLVKEGSGFHISEMELYKNIEIMWIQLGRQPKYSEVKKPLSKYSTKPYEKRFGSWLKALEKFVEHINSEEEESVRDANEDMDQGDPQNDTMRRRTNRVTFRTDFVLQSL